MNSEEIIKLARDAGFHAWYSDPDREYHFGCAMKFAALVAAAAKAEENEACAKVGKDSLPNHPDLGDVVAAAIRESLAEQPEHCEAGPDFCQICSDEQVQDILKIGNPTEEEYQLIRLGWDAAMRLAEQPAQQQPAWRTPGGIPRFKPQPAQQEPVASLLVGQDSDGRYVAIAAKAHADTLPLGEHNLYASPPASKPLTDEVFISMMDSDGICIDPELAFTIKVMVECAHGIYPENSDCHDADWTDRDGEYLK